MTRRLILILVLCLALSVMALAQEAYTPSLTLLSAVTATGAGSIVDSSMVTGKCGCTASWAGTVPTNIVFALEGSQLNTAASMAALATVTMTSSPWSFHCANKNGMRYYRGNYVSKSGGDATTSLSLSCTFGGN